LDINPEFHCLPNQIFQKHACFPKFYATEKFLINDEVNTTKTIITEASLFLKLFAGDKKIAYIICGFLDCPNQ
jgi:hypothetical protein